MSEISSPAHFPIAIAEDGLSAAVCTCDREWCWGGNHFPLRRPPLAFDYQTFLYHKAHCEVRAPTGSNFSGDADLPRDQNCGAAGTAHADFLQGERQPLHASKGRRQRSSYIPSDIRQNPKRGAERQEEGSLPTLYIQTAPNLNENSVNTRTMRLLPHVGRRLKIRPADGVGVFVVVGIGSVDAVTRGWSRIPSRGNWNWLRAPRSGGRGELLESPSPSTRVHSKKEDARPTHRMPS